MLLPLGDTPNPRNFRPWVNWTLIGINVFIYLFISLPLTYTAVNPSNPVLQEYLRLIAPSLPYGVSLRQVLAHLNAYDLFVFAHGFKPGAPQISDLFFSMFLHGSIWHIAGNMLFLWIYGDNVEHRLGRLPYLAVYLGTGVVATMTFALFAGSSMVPTLGASGAISGILGIYFLVFPRNKVKTFVFLFPIFFDILLLPARWVLGFFLLVDNLLPVLLGSSTGVAYGAHIGGFFAGLSVAWVGERFAWHWPWAGRLRPAVVREDVDTTVMERPAIETVRSAMADNDPEGAIHGLAHLERDDLRALNPDECIRLATWLNESGHTVAATRLLRLCLAGNPTGAHLARVYLMLGLIRLRQGQPTAAYQHLLDVFEHDPDARTAAEARQALAGIDVYRKS